MFISNISQQQSVRFNGKNVQQIFPTRELILEKLDKNLAKQLGVKVPTTKDEQKTVVSEIYKQLHIIMLSMDKFAPVLRFIKLPTSKEEMAAQLSFLTHRQHLSDCINLMNERAKLLMNRNMLSGLENNNPNISTELKAKLMPNIPEIKQELANAGDVASKLKSLSNRISYAEIEQRESVQYFKDLEKKQAILEDLGLLTDDMADQYWRVLREENINNSNLSAEQLIDIINKRAKIQTSSASLTSEEKAARKAQKKAAEAARKAQKEEAAKARKAAAEKARQQAVKQREEELLAKKTALTEQRQATKIQNAQTEQNSCKTKTLKSDTTTSKSKILSPKQLKNIIPLEYCKLLCKNIDFYRIMADNNQLFNRLVFRTSVTTLDYEKKRAHDIIWEKYSYSIDRCDHKSIVAFEKDMGDKFNQYYRFKNLVTSKVPEMYNVGGMWNYMEGKEGILEMKRYVAEIKELRKQLQNDPNNQSLLQNIARRDILLEQDKDLWIECLKKSIEGEKANYDKCVKNKCAMEYTYLTNESVSLKGYKRLYEICEINDGELPEEIWDRILTYAGEDGKLSEEAWAKILE